MREHDFENGTRNGREPWDTDSYETGSTCPPKNHREALALILVLGIILGGLLTVLGLKAELWQSLRQSGQPEEETLSVSLRSETLQQPMSSEQESTESMTVSSDRKQDARMELQPSPAGVENLSQEGGLSLQQIYTNCIDSTVSILCTLSDGSASGSGVVLTADGYVITNYHVVEGAVAIQVLLTDGRSLTARMVGGDKLSDLAVLRVDAVDLTPATFGDSDALRVGDVVVAIGDPLGVELRGTMTDGIVSAINRDITTEGRTMTLIQTNAALNAGNSGGPLINCYGQVIGINTMKIGDYVNSAGVEGLGFAIPSTTVKQVVEQLIAQGYVSGRPDLGFEGTDVPAFYQYYYRLPAGVYVSEIAAGSDAAALGIQVKDILVTLDGQRVRSLEQTRTILYNHQVGDTLVAVFYRAGQQYQVELTLTEATS